MSAPIEMECPNCKRSLRVPPAVFGKKIKCKHCNHAFVVQDPSAKPPSSGAKPPAAPAPANKPFMDDDDDEGPKKIEVITEGDDIPRCPHCAKELEPPDAIVCIHCGFNNVTRAKANTKKVWAPTFEDWFMHLLPGIIALAILIALIVLDIVSLVRMRDWLEGSFLEMDEKDAAGQKRFFVAPGFFIAVIMMASLIVGVPAAKFVYQRLIKGYMPPEKIKI
jgi:hypothetical protein